MNVLWQKFRQKYSLSAMPLLVWSIVLGLSGETERGDGIFVLVNEVYILVSVMRHGAQWKAIVIGDY